MSEIANVIRVNNIIKFKGRDCKVLSKMHTKPGKGGGYVQFSLKDIEDGTKFDERFRSNEKIERVLLEEVSCQFLYSEGGIYYFMNNSNYEQFEIVTENIEERTRLFLSQENLEVLIQFSDAKPIGIILPKHLSATIVETEAVVKGQTATSSYKPALLENGFKIMVPPFIKISERIIIDTEEFIYMSREKES